MTRFETLKDIFFLKRTIIVAIKTIYGSDEEIISSLIMNQ